MAIVAAAGGVGSLAVQLGKPMGAGRVIALASTQAKRDLTLELGRRRGDRLGPRGAEGAPDRGQRRAARSTSSSRWPADAVFDACLAALAPFGRLVTYGIASGEGNEVHSRKLMGRSRAVVGFWLMHCIGRPGMVDEALADLYARAARGELRAVVGATYRSPTRARPRSTWPSAARRARSCSTRAAKPAGGASPAR